WTFPTSLTTLTWIKERRLNCYHHNTYSPASLPPRRRAKPRWGRCRAVHPDITFLRRVDSAAQRQEPRSNAGKPTFVKGIAFAAHTSRRTLHTRLDRTPCIGQGAG